MGPELDARVVELELRYTEQQRLLQELSDVVWGQAQQLERLALEVDVLRQKLAAEPGLVDASVTERPPHY